MERKDGIMTDLAPVSVSKHIAASPQEIFAILTDPGRHLEIDGSGMLRRAIDAVPVSVPGESSRTKMYHKEFGDYEMNNTVVEYQPDRLIAWEPAPRHGGGVLALPLALRTGPGRRWHHGRDGEFRPLPLAPRHDGPPKTARLDRGNHRDSSGLERLCTRAAASDGR